MASAPLPGIHSRIASYARSVSSPGMASTGSSHLRLPCAMDSFRTESPKDEWMIKCRRDRQVEARLSSDTKGKSESMGRRSSGGRVPIRGMTDVMVGGKSVKYGAVASAGGSGHL